MANDVPKKAQDKFSKEAILSSEKFGGCADLLSFHLKDDVLYTMAEVERIFKDVTSKTVTKKINK